MVKVNDLIKRNYWTYPYLAYMYRTQMCVCLQIGVAYKVKSET